MSIILATGMLTVGGTAMSQVAPVFAEEDECNDNRDFNCNEETHKIEQENNCKIVNENENDDKSDENSNGDNSNGDITCWNLAQGPENGAAIVDEDLPDVFGPIGTS